MERNLRPLIRLAGEPLGCVDIVNSQPALLGNLLASKTPTNGVKGALTYSTTLGSALSSLPSSLLPSSVAPFLKCVSSGLLYEELAEKCDRDREFVKRRFIVDVLAKRGRYPSRVENVFRGLFPEVWRAVREINRDSHCNLIRMLQRLESWLVIERVSPELVDRVPIVTLHDAVFSRRGDLGIVEDVFTEVLEDIGWKITVKREEPAK